MNDKRFRYFVGICFAGLSLLQCSCSDLKKGQWLGQLDVIDAYQDDGDSDDSGAVEIVSDDLTLDVVTGDDLHQDSVQDITLVYTCESEDSECSDMPVQGLCWVAKCNKDKKLCEISLVDNDSPCNDGDLCRIHDVCQDGVCKGKFEIDCAVLDPCIESSCDPRKGCQYEPLSGGECDPSLPCTINGTCVGGLCVGAPDPTCLCPAPGYDCTTFDDEFMCNGRLVCNEDPLEPVCIFDEDSVVVCDAVNDTECSKNQCVEPDGDCRMISVRENQECDDRNSCTENEYCAGGVCGHGISVDCNDNNPCTRDRCDSAKGCINEPIETETGCDDRNPCTYSDLCHEGTCRGTSYSCNDDGFDCTEDNCNGMGKCLHPVKSGYCFIDSVCYDDQVVNPVNPCQFCDSVSKQDTFSSYDDGTPCPDNGQCQSGTCVPIFIY